jgi:3D (Asp-Asp-Asp) domain-containing protein
VHRIATIIMTVLAVTNIAHLFPQKEVLGSYTRIEQTPIYAEEKIKLVTTTAFSQREISEDEALPFDTKYEKTKDQDYGTEEITQEGVNGLKTYFYLLTHWGDEVIDRQLLRTETEEPVTQVISQGTRVTWRILEGTEHGRLKYWHKMTVWATKYDANCIGCTGRTYSGTEVKKGVCATDPKVIPLGTNFYVDGYGLCRAEDIGGAIKGNKIDLGYVDASKGEWRTGYTTIYLLTNAPNE